MALKQYTVHLEGDTVVAGGSDGPTLRVNFKRTIRVPDNQQISALPPDLGNFPLFKVKGYTANLPTRMAQKGGLFMPVYQREAMWIDFSCTTPFIIKVYVGGVNVTSGEAYEESIASKLRRQTLLAKHWHIQDYVVAANQRWIDEITTAPGTVGQFVAMPTGQGYSIEAQITGKEVNSGLLFEITPTRYDPDGYQLGQLRTGGMRIYVKTMNGQEIPIYVRSDNTVYELKVVVEAKVGLTVDQQRLIYAGKKIVQLEDGRSLSSYGIQMILSLVPHVSGGGNPYSAEMGLAKGGRIAQFIATDRSSPDRWNAAHTMAFNVQLLNSTAFTQVTGLSPPATPVSAEIYAAAGYPFFKLYEERSDIHGAFDNVKSINEIDGIGDPSVTPKVVAITPEVRQPTATYSEFKNTMADDPDGIFDPTGPLREFRTLTGLKAEMERMALGISREAIRKKGKGRPNVSHWSQF